MKPLFKKSSLIVCALPIVIWSCGSDKKTDVNTSSNTSVDKTEEIVNEVPVSNNSFGGLITELESYIGWSAVNESWKTRRESWVAECLAASTQEEKAALLMEFETVINWEAVDKRWADRRTAWVHDCGTVSTEEQLNDLLAEFETYILWDAVSPEWANVREDWMSRAAGSEGDW